MTKECPNCGKIISSDADFCGYCGQKIEKIKCPNCGILIKSHLSFCPECGAKLNERKKPSLENLDPEIKKQLIEEIKKELNVDIKKEELKEIKRKNRKHRIKEMIDFCHMIFNKVKNSDENYKEGYGYILISILSFIFIIWFSFITGIFGMGSIFFATVFSSIFFLIGVFSFFV